MRKFTLLICTLVTFSMLLSAFVPVATTAKPASADKVTITIESWRNDDIKIWQDIIIPAFEKQNPGIHVEFAPTAPAEYNGVLDTKLQGGTAGDLITCRPFDASLKLFQKGYLAPPD